MDRPGSRGLVFVLLVILGGVGCTGKDEANSSPSNGVQESSPENAAPDAKPTAKPETSSSQTEESVGGLIGDLMARPGSGKEGAPGDLAGVKLTGDPAADKAVIVKALEDLQAEWKRTKAEYRKLTDAKVPARDIRMKALKTKNEMLGKQAEGLQALLDKLAERGR